MMLVHFIVNKVKCIFFFKFFAHLFLFILLENHQPLFDDGIKID